MIVGFIGSGRKTWTTPSASSRVLPPRTVLAASDMLLVERILDREREAQLHLPCAHGAVLDDRDDVRDLGLADTLDGGRGARDRETDGVLDGVRRGTGERDRLLDHGVLRRAIRGDGMTGCKVWSRGAESPNRSARRPPRPRRSAGRGREPSRS